MNVSGQLILGENITINLEPFVDVPVISAQCASISPTVHFNLDVTQYSILGLNSVPILQLSQNCTSVSISTTQFTFLNSTGTCATSVEQKPVKEVVYYYVSFSQICGEDANLLPAWIAIAVIVPVLIIVVGIAIFLRRKWKKRIELLELRSAVPLEAVATSVQIPKRSYAPELV